MIGRLGQSPVGGATLGRATAIALAGCWILLVAAPPESVRSADHVAELQQHAALTGTAPWGHWGTDAARYAAWKTHSNRLIPIYTFGMTLESWRRAGSPYRSAERIEALYGRVPEKTLNPKAAYFDQTQVWDLQRTAVAAGKKYIILFVFDGMDWETTRAAAVVHSGRVYQQGWGSGLAILDYRGAPSDRAFFVCSPYCKGASVDVNSQHVRKLVGPFGGYDARQGGAYPWSRPASPAYLIAQGEPRHAFTDSASSATALTSGRKTFNGAINVDPQGKELEPIGRWLQRTRGFRVGVVTSVPISHATPAAAYANNVSRGDYQDLTRDLLGRPSVAHQRPLPGVDVLLGAGWGEVKKRDGGQGANFVPGNRYITDADRQAIDRRKGGAYVVVERTGGAAGPGRLAVAAHTAAQHDARLFGLFGVRGGHLPFRTADGAFDPVPDIGPAESYSEADRTENPTLAHLADAALTVLGRDERPFWLMIEAGDVDWANHRDNIDNSIGAVLSGDEAFRHVVQWIESHDRWDETAVIVTADHGHLFFLTDPRALCRP